MASTCLNIYSTFSLDTVSYKILLQLGYTLLSLIHSLFIDTYNNS